MAGLKVYYDLMSQPCRALYLFLKATKIPYTEKLVALRKGEHLSDEYSKLNPYKRVPVIDDNGFILTESVAILKYLADKHKVADHWYPKDLQKRAKVDEYIGWQHTNTRLNAAMVFRTQIIEPRMKQIPIDQGKLRRFQAELDVTLDLIENMFLKDQKYLCGEEISIADLLGVCELAQPYACGQDVRDGRPKLAAWFNRVTDQLQPEYDVANKMVLKVREIFLKNQSKM